MLSDDKTWTNPNVGGAPDTGMPMRQETFYFERNDMISDSERLVSSGRINPKGGSKYWGSYL